MNDALLVRGFERLGDLLGDRQRLVDRDRAVRDALRQIVALDEFHHEGVDAPGFFEAVDGRDVRVVQGRERLRFAREPRQAIGITGERVRKDLHRDIAIQLRVARPVHLAHAAFADGRRDFVDAEARAGGEGQVVPVNGDFIWLGKILNDINVVDPYGAELVRSSGLCLHLR